MHKKIYISILLGLLIFGACSDNEDPVLAAKYAAALSAYKAQELDRAAAHLTEILDVAPDYPGVRVMLGKVHYHKQDYKKALELFEDAADANPGDLGARTWMARSYRIQGDSEAALQAINQVVQMEGANIEAWYLKGQIHEGRSELDDAFAAYQYGLREGEKLALIHIRLEALYRDAGLPQRAEEHRAQAVSLLRGLGSPAEAPASPSP